MTPMFMIKMWGIYGVSAKKIQGFEMKVKVSRLFSMPNLLILYWAIYWIMNGLDKFLNRQELGFFSWHGKDRTAQFSGYFNNTDIPLFLIDPLLYLVGTWEILIAIPLVISLWVQVFKSSFDMAIFKFGMSCGAVTFIIFSFADVIFGDRAELLEHGTFLILIAVTYHLVIYQQAMKKAMMKYA